MDVFIITYHREVDGRWIAEIEAVPGALAYGETWQEARDKVKTLVDSLIGERESSF